MHSARRQQEMWMAWAGDQDGLEGEEPLRGPAGQLWSQYTEQGTNLLCVLCTRFGPGHVRLSPDKQRRGVVRGSAVFRDSRASAGGVGIALTRLDTKQVSEPQP